MDTKELYREILNERNLNPSRKKKMDSPTMAMDGVNPSCGDAITLNLKVDGDGRIVDGSFTGSGCAVSQASVDIMLDLIVGKTREEAERLSALFIKMIQSPGQITDEEREALDEAAALEDISRMPARAKCAVLGWRTLEKMLESRETQKSLPTSRCCSDGCALCSMKREGAPGEKR